MNKCKICNEEIPNRIKIDNKIRNLSSRQFCLKCSPWGHHNTKDLLSTLTIKETGEKKCPVCKEVKNLSEFYKRRNNADPSPYCKVCTNNQAMDRQRAFKEKCVEYKGGQCQHCGYNKSLVALEFHHVDPSIKDFSISKVKSWTFDERTKSELDKCILICRNCHAEEHLRLSNIKWRPRRDLNPQPTA